MPRWIVVQPNGFLAEFSTIVDDFTVMDMTPDEAVEWHSLWLPYDKAKTAIDDAIHEKDIYTDEKRKPLHRWADAVSRVRAAHGLEKANERKLTGQTNQ